MKTKRAERHITKDTSKDPVRDVAPKPAAIIIFIILLGFIAYTNSFKNQFVFDDMSQIINNTAIRSFRNIPKIFTHSLAYFGGEEKGKFFRPIVSMTFMVDYFLWGSDPIGYHLTNTLLHILVAILLFRFLRLITSEVLLSGLTALLYIVHPVHTEAVTYVSGRADSLAAIFLLLMTVYQYRYWLSMDNVRRSFYYFIILLSFILALLVKESAISFPFLLLFCEYCLRAKAGYTKVLNKRILFYLPFLLIAGAWFVFKNRFVPTDAMVKDVPSFNTNLITLCRLIHDYVKLSFLPINLHMEYKLPFPESLFQSGYFGPFLFTIVFLLLLHYLWNKGKWDSGLRIIFWGFGWFLIALLPYLNILFYLNAAFAEHWLYIPEMGFLASIVYFLFYRFRNNEIIKRYALFLCISVIAIFSYMTIRQNMVWRDGITFYQYTLKHAPYSEKTCNNLAVEYIKRGDLIKAKELLKTAVKIDPHYDTAVDNLRKLNMQLEGASKRY